MILSHGEWRDVCRTLGQKYGFTPEQIGNMPDDVLYDLIPGMYEASMAAKFGGKKR